MTGCIVVVEHKHKQQTKQFMLMKFLYPVKMDVSLLTCMPLKLSPLQLESSLVNHKPGEDD